MRIVFLCLLVPLLSFGQNIETAVQVYNETFMVGHSSASGLTLSAKNTGRLIDIELPPNTVRWYYSYYVSSNESEVKRNEGNQKLLNAAIGLASGSTAVNMAISLFSGARKDVALCSFYLLQSKSDVAYFNNGDGRAVSIGRFSREGSISSTAVMVDDPKFISGHQYLGIRNTTSKTALNVNVQVVAIVRKPITDNGWSRDVKQKAYNGLKNILISKGALKEMSNENLDAFVACFTKYITRNYTPEQYNSLADYEMTNAMKYGFAECKYSGTIK